MVDCDLRKLRFQSSSVLAKVFAEDKHLRVTKFVDAEI